MKEKRNVLTIATGKTLYLEYAINLAYSFLLWHPQTDVTFYIATDIPQLIPAGIPPQISIITIQPKEFGEGFSPKLHLDKIAPEGNTIFIDSDCLIFENIEYLFDRFKDHHVSVIGNYISDGEWFGDIAKICKKFNVPHMPKFNGGLYYLEKNPKAGAVYEQARKLEQQYNEIGFVRLRGRPNDEVLMALSMQLHGETPLIDDGKVMSDPQACPGGYYIDVLKGKRWLINPPAGNANHQEWYPFQKVSPAIVHFLGHHTHNYPYRREVYKLRKLAEKKPAFNVKIFAYLSIQLPGQALNGLKKVFRPLYHLFFGYRKIKRSDRIV